MKTVNGSRLNFLLLIIGILFSVVRCGHHQTVATTYREIPVTFSGEPVPVRFSKTPVSVWTKTERVLPEEVTILDDKTKLESEPNALRHAFYFSEGDYALTTNEKKQLDALAEEMASTSSYRLLIRGYTNANGSEEYNYELGLKRANAVREYLLSRGLTSKAFEIESLGEKSDLERKAVIEPVLAE